MTRFLTNQIATNKEMSFKRGPHFYPGRDLSVTRNKFNDIEMGPVLSPVKEHSVDDEDIFHANCRGINCVIDGSLCLV